MPVPATPLNRLRQLWSEGRPAFGAIATIPSVQLVQIMARSLDWIIVDLEHGPIGLTEAHAISDGVEKAILNAYPNAEVIIHQDPAGVETQTTHTP